MDILRSSGCLENGPRLLQNRDCTLIVARVGQKQAEVVQGQGRVKMPRAKDALPDCQDFFLDGNGFTIFALVEKRQRLGLQFESLSLLRAGWSCLLADSVTRLGNYA